eukprot:g18600.t1
MAEANALRREYGWTLGANDILSEVLPKGLPDARRRRPEGRARVPDGGPKKNSRPRAEAKSDHSQTWMWARQGSRSDHDVLSIPPALHEWFEQRLRIIRENENGDDAFQIGMPFSYLKQAHLSYLQGQPVKVVEQHCELPSRPRGDHIMTPLEGCILGGLDTAAPIVAPPKGASTRTGLNSLEYFGAKWDHSEYYAEDGDGDDMKLYCKHLNVLYRSYASLQQTLENDELVTKAHHQIMRKVPEAKKTRDRRESLDWGLYVGLSGEQQVQDCRVPGGSARWLNTNGALVGRCSYALHSCGRHVAIDTGDSSALVASDTAVRALREKEGVPFALASGASWIENPYVLGALCSLGYISRSGRTRVFDASSDGYTLGEGVVSILLQKFDLEDLEKKDWAGLTALELRLRDWLCFELREVIGARALLSGSGVNSRGTSASVTAPSGPAVIEVVALAMRDAHCPSFLVDAVEASASGQTMFDQVELKAMGRLLEHKDAPRWQVLSRSVTARVAMMKVLDYLMDVKDGMLAEAIADEKKLDYFKNNAKETKATCELLDKWGRHYESKGAPPNTGGGKIAQAWKDLTKDGVRFPMTYDYLTLTPAPSDAGAFSAAVERHAASSELDEALLGRLADAMQTALERHGRESMEFGEAKAHFESTLEQWQHAVEAAADGDPERFARLFDVVSRYAERQQSIESGATALGAAPLGAAPALPASPSTGSRASREEEAPSEPRSHRRRRRKSAERLPEVATPSFGDWRPEEAASDSLGSFGGSFGLQSFPSFGPDGAGFGDPMGPSTFGISDGFGGFGPGDLPDHGSDASFGGDLGPNFGSRMEQPTWSEQPLDPVQEELPDVRPSFAPPAPEQTDQMAELCRKLAQEVQELRSQAENDSSKEEVEALRRRVKELEAQDVSAKKDSTISSLREANMQLQAELDQRGLELSAIRKRALEAERRLSEKDEVFQDTCQRLLDAQRRIAQLEDDLAGQVEVQQSLENRLQGAKALNTATELELKQVRHALGSVTGLDSETRRSNVPYGFPGGDQRPPSPSVSQADELASSMAEKASRLEVDYGGHTGAYLPRSSLQTWKLTPRVRQPGALLRRPASHVIALNTAAHFRQLLGEAQGILYEDHQVLLSMNFHPLQQAGPRQKIHFEVSVSNRGAHPIHDVRLQPAETSNVHPRCFDVQLAPQAGPKRLESRVLVFGVDDIGPQVDLSYLQPDSQSLRARLRLPFTSRFLQVAPKTSPARWDDAWTRWEKWELVHTEVACVCELRKSLVAACTSAWQALEMGGALKCIPGMAGFPGALFAGCFQAPGGEAVELLLHVELGLPDTVEGGQSLCRLAVRSTSAPVNRAVAQANGVTFVQSNDSKLLGGISRPWEAYGSLADESKLPCRVFLTVAWQDVGSTAPKAKQFHSSGLLSCDRAKIWTDGGLGAKTAAMLEPYADDPQNSGVMQMSTEEIAKAMGHLKEHGFRVEAHAIGDRAASDLIDAFEKFMPSTERPVLTHCQFLNKNLVERMSKGGIIANVQPQFVPSDLPIIKSRVGEGTERFNYAYVWRTLMKAGVHVAGGSDAPVEAPTPLVGMADAMEHALFASERLTFAEALSMYTTEAAFAACAEERIGTLEPGKDADFVVLDCNTDAEALTASQLRSCQVEKVYVQGKLVHDRTTNAKRRRIATGDGPGKSGLPFVRGRCPACSMTSHRTCSGSR